MKQCYLGQMGRPKGSAIPPDIRRSRRNLAILLRERIHEEVIVGWLKMILSGKNPVIVEDKRYVEHGGLKVIADPDDLSAPSAERREQCLCTFPMQA